jgi:hypothetical protein
MEKICISAISGEYLDLLGEINSSAVRRQSSSEETEVAGMQNIFFCNRGKLSAKILVSFESLYYK